MGNPKDSLKKRNTMFLLINRFYSQLLAHFEKQHWWPGETPWEVAVGAVLTQNTNWRNVEKAIHNLKLKNALSVEAILNLEITQLAELIRPSGYFNLKAKRLKNLATWWTMNSQTAFDPSTDLDELRNNLLKVNGVGEETADSILLYAFGRHTFVVDAYTKKFLQRHKLIRSSLSYNQIKSLFEDCLPHDTELFKEYHALLVMLGKHYCKSKPVCEKCPLRWHLLAVDTSSEIS